MPTLRPSDLAPNLLIADRVSIGENVSIGANVVIEEGVTIEDGARICHGAILGRVAPVSNRTPTKVVETGPTRIGAGATICTGALVHAGVEICEEAFVGDNAAIREQSVIGVRAAVGFASIVKAGVTFGERARTQSHCVIATKVVLEDEVFLAPGVAILGGRLMSRPERMPAPILRRACQIGAGVQILPGVEIGAEAVVGAGAVVAANIPPATVVRGIPARQRPVIAQDG